MKSFQELEAALKKQQLEIQERERLKAPKIIRIKPKSPKSPRKKGTVLKPVNQSAARMMMPAHDWHKHPGIYRKQETNKMTTKKVENYEQSRGYGTLKIGKHILAPVMVNGEPMYTPEVFAEALVAYVKDEYVDGLASLALEASEARVVLETSIEDIKGPIGIYEDAMKSATQQVRMSRMTLTNETKHVLKALEDVRKFFIGKEYTEEVERLQEFVELCERLKALQDSGFLDSIADVLLKLA